MTMFQIEARDPLVFRDGRPNNEQNESRTLAFPLPSTLAGVVRTGLGRKNGVFDRSLIKSLLENVSIRGPLLAGPEGMLVPAPHDALILQTEDKTLRLAPLEIIKPPAGAFCSGIGANRQLVGLPPDPDPNAAAKTKPLARVPRFWPWTAFEEWLHHPSERDDAATRRFLAGAITSLVRDERVHVAMTRNGTAEEGKLFATEGLCLEGRLFVDETNGYVALQLLLDVDVQEPSLGAVASGIRPLGGERRLSVWTESTQPGHTLPALPPWLNEYVNQDQASLVRVVLLTPAYVESSLGPRMLERAGIAEIVAAKVDRPMIMSGWDLAKNPPHGQPKKTRRLADSGSVYWVRLTGDVKARQTWLKEIWMNNISDDPQLARDGFGLAAIGIGGQP